MSLIKLNMVFKEKNSRQCLRKKKTLGHQINDLVLVKTGIKSTVTHQIQDGVQGRKKP